LSGLRHDGSVFAWGDSSKGGNTDSVKSQLYDIDKVFGGHMTFVAVRRDGSLVTWGDSAKGGNLLSPTLPTTILSVYPVMMTYPRDDVGTSNGNLRNFSLMAHAIRKDQSFVGWGEYANSGNTGYQYSDISNNLNDGVIRHFEVSEGLKTGYSTHTPCHN
jgi:alpha-tubulin suppressor-like RCC1 family protein